MSPSQFLRGCAVLSLLCLSTAAFAQTADPVPEDMDKSRTIIVTGTKFSGEFGAKSGIALERLPQSVQIVTADSLIKQGATSIGDALRSVPSANIGNSRTSRFQSFSIKLRGFLADQMRNGIRQRYYEDVDASALSNIERIEVLKGPSAVLYGQSAVGGIISIITKQPQAEFTGSAAVTSGRFDQKIATIDVGGPISDTLGIRVTGEIERSGTFVDFQDIDRENLAVNVRWQPRDGIDAHLVAEYVERRTLSNPGLPVVGTLISNGVARVPQSRFLAEPAFADLKADSPLLQGWVDFRLADGWAITPRVQYSELNTPFTELRIRGVEAGNPLLVRRTGRIGVEDDSYTIAQLDLTGMIKTGSVTQTVLIGYEYDRERSIFIQSTLVSVPSINSLNPVYLTRAQRPALSFAFNLKQRLDSHAVYAQDQIELTNRLGLVLGIRHAWLTNDGFFSSDPTTFGVADVEKVEKTSFQAGATYKLDAGFSLFGGYNSGYDVENSFGGSPTVNGNRLQPETSRQFEAGLRFSDARSRFSLAAFEISRRDVAGDDPDNPGFSRNLGSLRVRGIEFEGESAITKSLTLTAGYAYLDGEIRASATPSEVGGRLADVPHHSANLSLAYDIIGTPFDITASGRYQSKRAIANANSLSLPSLFLADIGIGADVGKFRFDLTASNIFDRRYLTVSGLQGNANVVFPGDPLTIGLRAAVNF